MKKVIHAIYEHGVLRPLEPLEGLQENSEVELVVQGIAPYHPLDEIFGILPKEDADEIRRIIEEEFEKVNMLIHLAQINQERGL